MRKAATAKRKSSSLCFKKILLLAFPCLIGIHILFSASALHRTNHDLASLSSSAQDPIFSAANPLSNAVLLKQSDVSPKHSLTQTTSPKIMGSPRSDHIIAERFHAYTSSRSSHQALPDWMNDYFNWHHQQRELLRPHTVRGVRFLLMECWPWQRICGGTADRLRSIPLIIKIAHQTKRLLMIKWGRPAELEEFLVPPQGGLDWRVPDWLIPHLANQSNFHPATRVEKLVHLANLVDEQVVATRLQVHDHGSKFYNENRREVGEPLFRDIYSLLWSRVFTPTPPITTLIEQQLQSLDLMPGQYTAAHVRALYLEQERKPEQLKTWATNAVNCASMLRPGVPILFASDSTYATQMALEYGQTRGSHVVVARTTAATAQPLHLDKATTTEVSPEHYYDTFVDLYLLGMSHCLTYNIGGYGKWGLLLGYNSSCGMRHQKGHGFKKDNLAPCVWMDGRSTS